MSGLVFPVKRPVEEQVERSGVHREVEHQFAERRPERAPELLSGPLLSPRERVQLHSHEQTRHDEVAALDQLLQRHRHRRAHAHGEQTSARREHCELVAAG